MRLRRRLWIILLAAPLALLAADIVYWQIAVQQLEEGLAEWLAARQAAGWNVSHQPPERGGWPITAALTVPSLSLHGGNSDIPGGLSWSGEKTVLRVELLRPRTLEISARGSQRLGVAGATEIPFIAERLLLTVPLQAGPVPGFVDLEADDMRAMISSGGNASARSIRLRLDLPEAPQSGEPVLTFALRAEDISPPAGVVRPLGPRIASLAVEGALNGPVPTGRSPAERAAIWRDGGGSLEIRHLALGWGPLDLSASATLALDEQLQPMGAGSARVVGYAQTLDALAAHSVITRSAATAAKAVLSLLARSPDDGSPPDVEVPLTLQYRTLSMRQVPLLRLPELDWP